MNNWKVAAIILAIIVVLQFAFMVWVYSIGASYQEKDTECAINICEQGAYDAYLYDSSDNMCYCYLNNEIAKQAYVG